MHQSQFVPDVVKREAIEDKVIVTGTDRPTDNTTGIDAYFNTSTKVFSLWDGDSWVEFSSSESTPAEVTTTNTVTLTNKRITRRVVTVTQAATPTINTDNTDIAYITDLAQAITSMTTNLSGTPINGDSLIISITDNGTARAITWGASFESSGNVTLPTTTVISTRLDVGFLWNTATSAWRCVAVA